MRTSTGVCLWCSSAQLSSPPSLPGAHQARPPWGPRRGVRDTNQTAESTSQRAEGAGMPWRRVGQHTPRERTKTAKEKKRNTGESTYNRKQRNFTCSVVLMHQSTDRERDRQMERRRVCEKTWMLTLLWRSTVSCLAWSLGRHTHTGCSDPAFAIHSSRVRSKHKPHCQGNILLPVLLQGDRERAENSLLLPLPIVSAHPQPHMGTPALKKFVSTLCKVFPGQKHPAQPDFCL